LAARRGLKGFSALVEEALETYFTIQAQEDVKRAKTAALRGVLSAVEAEALRTEAGRLRSNWR